MSPPLNSLVVLALCFAAVCSGCAPFPPSSPAQPYVFLVASAQDLAPLLANMESLLESKSTHPCLILSSGDPQIEPHLARINRSYGSRVIKVPQNDQQQLAAVAKRCETQANSQGTRTGGQNFVLFPKTTSHSDFLALYAWALDPELYSAVVFLSHIAYAITHSDELFLLGTDFAAPPDFFLPSTFNPAVLMLRPDPEKYRQMISRGLTDVPAPNQPVSAQELLYSSAFHKTLGRISFDGALRGFLNYLHPHWVDGPGEGRLHSRYGADFAPFCTFAPAWDVLGEKKVVLFGHCVPQDPWNAVEPQRAQFMDNVYVTSFRRKYEVGSKKIIQA